MKEKIKNIEIHYNTYFISIDNITIMPASKLAKKCSCFSPTFIFSLVLIILILVVYCYRFRNVDSTVYEHAGGEGALTQLVANSAPSAVNSEGFVPGRIPDIALPAFRSPMIQENPSINRTSYEINALDRIYNPLRYPYKSVPYYRYEATYVKPQRPLMDPNAFFSPAAPYPDLRLPAPVVGCGARREPCYGGSQEVIPNLLPPVDVSENNIAPVTISQVTAPVNISTRGPLGQPQQVGVLYKIFGNENEIHPLFGRRKYPNGNKWEYYTMVGKYGVKMPLKPIRNNEELGNNDEVEIQGLTGKYRVTVYESDFPQYIPYV